MNRQIKLCLESAENLPWPFHRNLAANNHRQKEMKKTGFQYFEDQIGNWLLNRCFLYDNNILIANLVRRFSQRVRPFHPSMHCRKRKLECGDTSVSGRLEWPALIILDGGMLE